MCGHIRPAFPTHPCARTLRSFPSLGRFHKAEVHGGRVRPCSVGSVPRTATAGSQAGQLLAVGGSSVMFPRDVTKLRRHHQCPQGPLPVLTDTCFLTTAILPAWGGLTAGVTGVPLMTSDAQHISTCLPTPVCPLWRRLPWVLCSCLNWVPSFSAAQACAVSLQCGCPPLIR